jgi:predicted dienelactone hydrolase
MRYVATVVFTAALFFVQADKVGSNDGARVSHLPAPSGPFAVGRVSYDWTDPSRSEPLSDKKGAHREVVVMVWYPAVHEKGAIPAPYYPDFKAARAAVSDDDFKDIFRPADQEIEKHGLPLTHSIDSASMSHDTAKHSVLIFSHGWGLQSPVYTSVFEDLASHGYIVAAIEHPYDTTVTVFSDGRVARFAQERFDAATKKSHGYIDYAYERIDAMAEDIPFVINQLSKFDQPQLGAPFAGHLNLDRIGAFGHSIGGMASARACQIESRLRACLDEDSTDDIGSPFSVITAGSIPKQPFLLFIATSADIFSQSATRPSDESLAKQKLSREEFDTLIQKQQRKQDELLSEVRSGAYRVMLFDLPGVTHRCFSDLPLLAAGDDPEKWGEALHNFQIVQAYTRGFFDKYVKNDQQTVLDDKSPPDIRVKVDRFGPAAAGKPSQSSHY